MGNYNNHNWQGSAISVIQFARLVQVSETTARRMIREGAIRAHRVGRQWRVFEADLQEYLVRTANQCAKEGLQRAVGIEVEPLSAIGVNPNAV